MFVRPVKCLLVAVFSVLSLVFSPSVMAQNDRHLDEEDEQLEHNDANAGEKHEDDKEGHGKFDANEVIFGHVMDAHEFHFFSIGDYHATLPLPVILFEPGRGLSVFSSSKFHHGHDAYNGYRLVTAHYREELKAGGMGEDEIRLLSDEQIIAVDADGRPLRDVKVYDLSLTRNVVQMLISLAILVWMMIAIAKRYRRGEGVTTAPTGWQNAIEPVITFVRDEVAKPNIGHKYRRYMPLLLTIFFFILINNVFGLIPGSANVTGNIAFTAVLGLVAFLVITFSGNKHYWGHIFNPPVPFGIKFIMIPVEILSIFTKPFALIIRLFANMLAGHIIIICLVSLIFIFGNMSSAIGWGFSPISIAFAVFIYVIEVLVAFIQAFIFTNLTAVFIGQSVDEGHHGHEDNHAPTEPVII
jgi:F-type H+-transporting ATPase subunit a